MGAAGNKKPKKSKDKKHVPSYVAEEATHETPLKNKKKQITRCVNHKKKKGVANRFLPHLFLLSYDIYIPRPHVKYRSRTIIKSQNP